MKYYSAKTVTKILGVTAQTLKEIIDDTKEKIKGENKNIKRTLLKEMSKNVAETIK